MWLDVAMYWISYHLNNLRHRGSLSKCYVPGSRVACSEGASLKLWSRSFTMISRPLHAFNGNSDDNTESRCVAWSDVEPAIAATLALGATQDLARELPLRRGAVAVLLIADLMASCSLVHSVCCARSCSLMSRSYVLMAVVSYWSIRRWDTLSKKRTVD